MSNLVSIISFSVILVLCTGLGWIEPKADIKSSIWLGLMFVSVGSVALGVVLGLLISVLHSKMALPEMILVFFAVMLLLMVGDNYLMQQIDTSFNPMVVCLVMGIVFENAALDPQRFDQTMDIVSLPLFALFFVMAGYNLHVEKLPEMTWLGVVYIIFRTIGKLGGIGWGIRRCGINAAMIQNSVGRAMLCQAGVAIGLGVALQTHWKHEMAGTINTVILASVTLYELVGPLLVKNVVVKSGEVKVVSLLRAVKNRSGPGLSGILWERFKSAVQGRKRSTKVVSPEELTAKHVMRTNVRCLPGNAPLDEVLRFVESSRLHDFPVIGLDRNYLGIIHFAGLRNLAYDPTLAHLVTAVDIADETGPMATVNSHVSELLEMFHQHNQGAVPIVNNLNDKHFLGIVEQRDLLKALHTSQAAPVTKERKGIVVVGAGPVARIMGLELQKITEVKLIDTNKDHCMAARADGVRSVIGSALIFDDLSLTGAAGLSQMVALTPNEDVNMAAAKLGREKFGIPEAYYYSVHEAARGSAKDGSVPLYFGETVDIIEWDVWVDHGETTTKTYDIIEPVSAGDYIQSNLDSEKSPQLPLLLLRTGKAFFIRKDRKLLNGDRLVVLVKNKM